jgi:hypothetical protein
VGHPGLNSNQMLQGADKLTNESCAITHRTGYGAAGASDPVPPDSRAERPAIGIHSGATADMTTLPIPTGTNSAATAHTSKVMRALTSECTTCNDEAEAVIDISTENLPSRIKKLDLETTIFSI